MTIRTLHFARFAVIGMVCFGTYSNAAFADVTGDTLEACATAAERAQRARLSGQLLRARGDLLVCGAPACPAIVRQDCLTWLSEVDDELPSVLLRARDARGRDVIGVRVYANGQLIAEELHGQAIALDPGRYELRYETRAGTQQERSILLQVREKRRAVTVRFAERLESDGSAARLPQDPPAPRSPELSLGPARRDAPAPTAGYILGAAGLAALGGFAYFELKGQGRYHDLKDGCGRTRSCSEDEVTSVRTDFILAGSLLAASAVFLGLSTWQLLTSRPRTSTTGRGAAGLAPRPAVPSFRLHF
jgi:hypothetical protein